MESTEYNLILSQKNEILNSSAKIFSKPVIQSCNEYMDKIEKFSGKIVSFPEMLESPGDLLGKVSRFNEDLHKIIVSLEKFNETVYNQPSPAEQKSLILDQINLFPDFLVLSQNISHFDKAGNDPFLLKSRKLIKRILLHIQRTLKKDDAYFPERTIPVRILLYWFIGNKFWYAHSKLYFSFQKVIFSANSRIYNLLLESDKVIQDILKVGDQSENSKRLIKISENFSLLKNDLKSGYDSFISSSRELISEYLMKTDEALGNAGTSSYRFEKIKISRTIHEEKQYDNYDRYLNARINDFIFYSSSVFIFFREITQKTITAINHIAKTKKSIDRQFAEKVKPLIQKSEDLFNEQISHISENDTRIESLIENIKNTREIINRDFTESLGIRLVKEIEEIRSSKLLESVSEKTITLFSDIRSHSVLIKPKKVRFGLTQKDYVFYDPSEVISLSYLDRFQKSLELIAGKHKLQYSSIASKIIDIGNVSDYSLETSAVDISSKSDTEKKELRNTAVSGLRIAAAKFEEIEEQLLSLIEESSSDSHKLLLSTVLDIRRIFDSTTLLDLKVSLSRKKLAARVISLLKGFRDEAEELLVRGKHYLKYRFTSAKTYVSKIESKVGIAEIVDDVSLEMIRYLQGAGTGITNLPRVYQRLFRHESLTDKRFFIGRTGEITDLKKTFQHWSSGFYSACAVLGEKGAGATTLFNFAFLSPAYDVQVKMLKFPGVITDENQLIGAFVTEFQLGEISDLDELIEVIKLKFNGHIILIENFEDIFLRIIDGFGAVESMQKIISSTGKNIFWVVNCNRYAWNYLSKTTSIGEIFTRTIVLKKFTSTEIENIIMKRHQLSGYKLIFLPSGDDLKSKLYKKLPETERNEFLRKKFFNGLDTIASGNATLALTFWIRSISNLSESRINIDSLDNVSFGFLKKLDAEKNFLLAAMIMHDGLTIGELAKIFNYSLRKAELLLSSLEHKGIIFERNKVYKINFLLYREVIKLLEGKNVIH